jgi:hypothetical protein
LHGACIHGIADWAEEDRNLLASLMTRLAASVDRLAAETETG